jgi:predicted aspartyl protease
MALADGAVVIVSQERLQLVDTGSSSSMVNEETARKMGWQIHDNARIRTVDASGRKTAVRHWTRIEQMQIGGVTFRDFRMFVAVENGPSRVPSPGELLGLPLFSCCLLTLDFPNETMLIEPPPAEAPSGGIRGQITDGLLYIPVQFGCEQSWALVDTGSHGLITVNSELASRLQFVQPPVETGWATSLSGSYRVRKGRLAGDVTIGGHVFHQPIVQITDGPTSIGTKALTPFIVKISPRHQWMSLEAPGGDQRIIETPPLWDFGLRLDVDGDRRTITDVLPESEAARSGLRAGDVVVKVNGGPWSEAVDTHLLLDPEADTPAVTLTADRGELVNLVIRPTLLVP